MNNYYGKQAIAYLLCAARTTVRVRDTLNYETYILLNKCHIFLFEIYCVVC